jgi:hypothetical protein
MKRSTISITGDANGAPKIGEQNLENRTADPAAPSAPTDPVKQPPSVPAPLPETTTETGSSRWWGINE